jgi:hypothetical protein
MKLYYMDRKGGWPVELFKGRPIFNFFRLLIHCRYITTKRPACLGPRPDLPYEQGAAGPRN